MKKFAFLGLILVGVILACIFIFRKSEMKETAAVIPVDAKLVAYISPEIYSQSDLSAFFNEYHEEWEKAGLDTQKPVYGFLSNQKTFGFVLPLNGKGLDTGNEYLKQYVEGKKRGLLWASSDSWTLCSDKDRCLVMMSKDTRLRNMMYDLMQKKEVDCPKVDTLKTGFSPVRFLVEANTILPLIGLPLRNADLSNTQIRGDIHQNGQTFQAVLHLETENEQVKKFLKTADDLLQPVEGTFSGMGPQNPLAWLTFNVKGEKLLPVLRSIPKVRTALIGLNFCADVDQMIKSIDGDVSLTLREYPKNNLPLLMTAHVSNTEYMRSANSWSLKALGLQIGAKDEMLYATMDSECANHVFDLTTPREIKSGSKLYLTIDSQKMKDLLTSVIPAMWRPFVESLEEISLEFPAAEYCMIDLKMNKSMLDLLAK